jgi:hypothetical protein
VDSISIVLPLDEDNENPSILEVEGSVLLTSSKMRKNQNVVAMVQVFFNKELSSLRKPNPRVFILQWLP